MVEIEKYLCFRVFRFYLKSESMRKPLTQTQSVILTLFWAALCFFVLTASPKIDGPLIMMILISGALVFIPIIKSMKKH